MDIPVEVKKTKLSTTHYTAGGTRYSRNISKRFAFPPLSQEVFELREEDIPGFKSEITHLFGSQALLILEKEEVRSERRSPFVNIAGEECKFGWTYLRDHAALKGFDYDPKKRLFTMNLECSISDHKEPFIEKISFAGKPKYALLKEARTSYRNSELSFYDGLYLSLGSEDRPLGNRREVIYCPK